MFQNWSSDDFYLPDMFIQNDQSTAGVSIADVSGLRGATDVNISLLYLWGRAGGGTEVVKGFETFFHSGKSGMVVFYCE